MTNMESDDNALSRVPRRPGRPGTESQAKDDTRYTILDSAEQLFAKLGYAATSFRDIAVDANVNPALISYYFGSKRVLHEAVYKRRGKELTDRWSEMLDVLEARIDQPPTVEEIIRVYLSAQFAMKEEGAGGLAFFRLQTRLHSEPEEAAFILRREVYDTVGKRFVALLERALPEVDTADISWRFVFLVGVSLYMTSDVDRLNDLSSGRFDSTDLDEALERMMTFCTVGMRAPSTQFKARKIPRKRKLVITEKSLKTASRARAK
jgi:AcrR family transcriptional regulator